MMAFNVSDGRMTAAVFAPAEDVVTQDKPVRVVVHLTKDGYRVDGKDLVLTFKIVDVYPGTTYDDTAITEIFFDGMDVH